VLVRTFADEIEGTKIDPGAAVPSGIPVDGLRLVSANALTVLVEDNEVDLRVAGARGVEILRRAALWNGSAGKIE
jgi:hypothetical protein